MAVVSNAPAANHTRAVGRRIEPGSLAVCAGCGERVKFVAREQGQQVIANVYVGGRWDRVEHFHAACYDSAGSPHGPPGEDTTRLPRRPRDSA